MCTFKIFIFLLSYRADFINPAQLLNRNIISFVVKCTEDKLTLFFGLDNNNNNNNKSFILHTLEYEIKNGAQHIDA